MKDVRFKGQYRKKKKNSPRIEENIRRTNWRAASASEKKRKPGKATEKEGHSGKNRIEKGEVT